MKQFRTLFLITALLLICLCAAGCSSNKEPGFYDPAQSTAASQSVQTTTAENLAVPDIVITTEEETAEQTTEAPTTETEAVTTEEETSEAEAPSAETAEPFAVGSHWYVNADALKLRQSPSVEAAVIDTLYRGEQVLILAIDETTGWVQVFTSKGTGYAAAGFLCATYTETGLSGTSSENDAPVETSSIEAGAVVSTTAPVSGNGHIVCIDAGHQAYGISETEPNGPGSSVMKAKLTTGTAGCATGLAESQLNLTVSLALKQELINRGYTVVMIRETQDCTMSNAERAVYANNSGAEIFLRVHANSSNDSSVTGAMFYVPTAANPYLSADVINKSTVLGTTLLNYFCAATGAVNRGLITDDTMTGINWCTIPVTIAEMGFMSNPTEDALMADPSYQAKMVQGFANGIDAYFGL